MSLTKEFEYDCEIRGPYKAVQVRKSVIIKDDGVEISRSYQRHVLMPRSKDSGTWEDTDISGEPQEIQNICNAVWTTEIKSAYEAFEDSQSV